MELPINKGYTGLANLGNTCFLNSCIQALNHTYEFDQIRAKYERHVRPERLESTILREYEELRNIMSENNGVVSPNQFVRQVHRVAAQKGRDIFTGWAQNDMPEFLLFMIECIHASISRGISVSISGKKENPVDDLAVQCYSMLKQTYAKEYSEIVDLFYGISVSELWSADEKTRHSVNPEPFFMLDIPIPLSLKRLPTLVDCLDAYTETETLEGDNAWLNEKTGVREPVRKRITFWNFPKVLVITLKRFTPDGRRKINGLIEFPIETLDLSKYVSGYAPNSYMYELFAVCNHTGGVQGGHYTAFAKRSNGEWLHFNDTMVERIADPRQVMTPMAYCLFYRKKNAPV